MEPTGHHDQYQMFGLCHLLERLGAEELEAKRRLAMVEFNKHAQLEVDGKHIVFPELVSDQDKERVRGWLKYSISQADYLEFQAVHHRIELFTTKLNHHMTLSDLLSEIRTLREAFLSGLNFKCFYSYPDGKVKLLKTYQAEWQKALQSFPMATPEIL